LVLIAQMYHDVVQQNIKKSTVFTFYKRVIQSDIGHGKIPF